MTCVSVGNKQVFPQIRILHAMKIGTPNFQLPSFCNGYIFSCHYGFLPIDQTYYGKLYLLFYHLMPLISYLYLVPINLVDVVFTQTMFRYQYLQQQLPKQNPLIQTLRGDFPINQLELLHYINLDFNFANKVHGNGLHQEQFQSWVLFSIWTICVS